MKKMQNLTYTNLREVWPWHSMFKIREITGKTGFQFCKLTFLGVSDQAISTFILIQAKCQSFSRY